MPSTDPAIHADSNPDDLRASLLASYEEAEAAAEPVSESADAPPATDADPAPDAAATAPLPEEAAASTPKTDHPTDPKRYADGSFKPTKAAPEKAAADPNAASTDTTKASTEQPPTAALAPPAGWTPAEKAEWSKLSPVAQAAVSRREAEISRGGQQWSDEKRRYEAMIAPVADSARVRGMDAAQGIKVLVAAQKALDTDPINAIKRIAQSYGVDLATLAGIQAANGSPEAPQQPDIAMLVRQAIGPILAPIQERFTAEDSAKQQQAVEYVTTFATSPGHEHFDAVQDELMAMIPSIKAANPSWGHDKVLQDAYDRATFANPTTRAAILAKRDTDAEAQRVEAAKKRTLGARLAATSVTGAPSGAPATQAKDTLRGELEAAWSGA